MKIRLFLCPWHCNVRAYNQVSFRVGNSIFLELSNLTLSTVGMSVTCSDSSTYVCHSAIVTDSTLLSVRHIAIVTLNSNPSVCLIAIITVCYRYVTDAICNDSNSSAQVCDGNSEIGRYSSRWIPFETSHYIKMNLTWIATVIRCPKYTYLFNNPIITTTGNTKCVWGIFVIGVECVFKTPLQS